MKKILIVMAVLFGAVNMSKAQTNFIATLQHEGGFTHYYGAGALTAAYNAANTGDIITLSPGTFTSPGTIEKSITLRGAGIGAAEKTYIANDVIFYSEDSTMVITVEGIKFGNSTHVSNRNSQEGGKGTIKFIKSTFQNLNSSSDASPNDYSGPKVRLYNCAIYNNMYFYKSSNPDFLFYNCFVLNPNCSSSDFPETPTTFINCVIEWSHSYPPAGSAYHLNFYNCIFNWTGGYGGGNNDYVLPNTTTCHNCLSVNKNQLFKNVVSGGNNNTIGSAEEVFVTYRNGYNEGETFELTDATKEAFKGTDGTQIGMQGGNYPYNTTVQYPVITKFIPEAQTDKTGMLNVEVEVDGK